MSPLPLWKGKKYSCNGCGELIISLSLLSSTLVSFPYFPHGWISNARVHLSFPPSNFLLLFLSFFPFCMTWQSLNACYMPRASLSLLCNYIFISWPSEVVAIYCWGFWQLSNLLKVTMCLVVDWNPTMHQNLLFSCCEIRVGPFCKNFITLLCLKVEIAELQESYHNQTWICNYKVHVFFFF